MATPDPFTSGLLRTPLVDKNGLLTWPWMQYFKQRLTVPSVGGPDDSALLGSEGAVGGELQSVRDMAQLALLQEQGVRIDRDPMAELAVLIGDPPVREVVDSDARLMLALLTDERAPQVSTTVSTSTILTAFFADNEVPSGAINGVNVTFTLLASPTPAASLELYQNGALQRQGIEYTLAGNTITMTTAPITGDTLTAFYRSATSSVSYAENETPTGLINGVNAIYTLANNPNPDASLCLYHNGILERNGVDYTLSGVTITMNVAPITGDTLVAFYRY